MATTRALSIEDGNLGSSSTVKTTKNREYIDIDLNMNAKPTTGDIYKSMNVNAVKQAVKLLLMTNRTEKPFSPYYGADLNSFLFELGDPDTIDSMKFRIKESIRIFEPRVDHPSLIVNVILQPDNNSIDITLIFKIINTNESVEFTTRLNRLR